ncbi:MAG: type 1 glutamine amidotransferase [Acidimicrobiales bacterium]
MSTSPSTERRPHCTVAVVHAAPDPWGTMGALADMVAPRTDLRIVVAGRDPFPDPTGIDLGIVMGSGASAYDDTVTWLADELSWLKRMAEESSVLAVCFGAQALARALGGTVEPSPEPEFGWATLQPGPARPPTPPGPSDDPVPPARPPIGDAAAIVGPGPWFEFHSDRFTTPPGAEEVAHNAAGPQAFRYGRSLAVQFHPEMDRRALAAWRRSLGAGDPDIRSAIDRLEAGVLEAESAARDRLATLVDTFWSTVAGFT